MRAAADPAPPIDTEARTGQWSECGPYLDACRCRHRSAVPRDAAEIRAQYAASVARAIRSGWAHP